MERPCKWASCVQINIYLVEFISIHFVSIMKTNVDAITARLLAWIESEFFPKNYLFCFL